MCIQDGERKAYGAGLLSSFGELEYAMSAEPEVLPLDMFDAGERDYPITSYQPTYYQVPYFPVLSSILPTLLIVLDVE
jgi:phenylalanine-4-hydroxylase